ncbi:hypothetical protein [Thiohalorhabdus methylotrophus]|uniref:Two-component sensor histidine kinase n=1 Tax=Thiohalorhabdus methylotrophus TaxID=3242694 RepID=A0ABV4TQG9_9GAMM
MKRVLRWVLLAGGALFLLLGVSVMALTLLVDADAYRGQLENLAER